MITINFERCKGCGLCVEACPKKLIALSEEKHNMKGYYPAECTDNSSCISCTLCAMMCPECAIKVEKGE